MIGGLLLNILIFDRSLLSRSLKRWQGKKKVFYTSFPYTHTHPTTLHQKSQIYSIAWNSATWTHPFQFIVRLGLSCAGGMGWRSASKAAQLPSGQAAGLPAKLWLGPGPGCSIPPPVSLCLALFRLFTVSTFEARATRI